MMKKKTLLFIIVFPTVYNVFTAICGVISRIRAEYKDTVFFIWYRATLVIWLTIVLLLVSFIIKMIYPKKHKGKD